MKTQPLHSSEPPLTGLLPLALLIAVGSILIGCGSPKPTPYQPLAKNGGYEESRLQEDMYRVSFRGNYVTQETDVIDFVFLRAAELTVNAGYTHFSVLESYGKINLEAISRSNFSLGFGFLGGTRSSFWGVSGMAPLGGNSYGSDYRLSSHLAVFLIHMMREKPKSSDGSILDAAYLMLSLDAKKERSLQEPK